MAINVRIDTAFIKTTMLSPTDEKSLLAARYLSAAATTVLLWDHLLNVHREVKLIWQQPWTIMQALAMANYYGTQGAMLYFAYVMSGLGSSLSNEVCEGFVVFVATYGLISIGLSKIILLLRVVRLWDNRRSIKAALIIGLLLCYGISIAFDALTIRESSARIRYSSLLRTCYFSEKDVFVAGVWGGVLLYDIFVFALLVLNALNRPRRHDHEIISNLQRDGTAIFIMQFLLRTTNFVQSIASGAAQTFVAILIVWSLDTAISFRLFLKSNYVELAMGDRSRFDVISPSAEAVLITEEIELANM